MLKSSSSTGTGSGGGRRQTISELSACARKRLNRANVIPTFVASVHAGHGVFKAWHGMTFTFVQFSNALITIVLMTVLATPLPLRSTSSIGVWCASAPGWQSEGGIRPKPDFDVAVGSLRACICFARRDASFTPSYCLACSECAQVVNGSETRPFLALFHPLSSSVWVKPLASLRKELKLKTIPRFWLEN